MGVSTSPPATAECSNKIFATQSVLLFRQSHITPMKSHIFSDISIDSKFAVRSQ